MNAIRFLILRQFKNRLRRTFSRPASAILAIFVTMFYILGPVMILLRPREMPVGDGGGMVLISIMPLILGFLFLNTMLSQQSGIFTPADANFMFTSPVTERQALWYAILQAAPASFLMTIFMTLWLPYMIGGRMAFAAFFASLLDMALMFCGIFLFYYFIYVLDIAHPGAFKKARAVLLILVAAAAGGFVLVLSRCSWQIDAAAKIFFESPFYNALPLFGWARWGMLGSISGSYAAAFLPATLLLTVFAAAAAFGMLGLHVDYYEKALSDSARVQKALEARRSGADARSLLKASKGAAKVKGSFRPGAAAIFSKQWLEMRKSSPFLTFRHMIGCLIYVVLAAVMHLGIYFVLGMILFMSLAETSNEAWNMEFKKPYAFLIPESSFKKLVFSVLPGFFKSLAGGCATLLLTSILLQATFVQGISTILLFAAFDLLFVCAEVFSYRILGGSISLQVLAFLRMLLIMVFSIPAAIALTVAAVITGDVGVPAAAAALLVNAACSALLLFLSRSLFETCEIMD